MRRTGSLIGLLLGAAAMLTLGARYYDRGMVAYWGDSTLTNLWPGQVYFNTSNTTLYVGNSSSNPVVVGSAAWSNNVTGSVTNGLASTNESRNLSVSNVVVNGDVAFTNTFWDDLRVPLFTRTAAGNNPTYAVFTNGVYAWRFGTGKELFWEAQLPHGYKHGSPIHFHVHTASNGTSTNAVIWGVEFTAATIGSDFPATVTATTTNAGTGVARRHGYTEIVEWTPPAPFLGSSIIIGRVFRGNDSNPDDKFLLAIDLHIERDKLGSPDELPTP